ncbi:MAG: homocysteine S-methyltransferase family protein [Planctomycetaceae bacterium]
MPGISLRDRLGNGTPLLLDGPTGTELARRGISTDTPEWSAAALTSAPEVVEQIHQDYIAAGAELITANTFRTHARSLGRRGKQGEARELTKLAVMLAQAAAGETAWVAGSMAPLEDCYRPDLTPSPDELELEHRIMAEYLMEAGVDLILAETHPTIRESVAAAKAARTVGLPVIVSWVCGRDGRLLSGETLTDAAAAVLPLGPIALSVNCLPAQTAQNAAHELVKAAGSVPVGVYANIGWAESDGHWVQGTGAAPADYAELASGWLDRRVRIIGGCCGTTPDHLLALRQMLDRD